MLAADTPAGMLPPTCTCRPCHASSQSACATQHITAQHARWLMASAWFSVRMRDPCPMSSCEECSLREVKPVTACLGPSVHLEGYGIRRSKSGYLSEGDCIDLGISPAPLCPLHQRHVLHAIPSSSAWLELLCQTEWIHNSILVFRLRMYRKCGCATRMVLAASLRLCLGAACAQAAPPLRASQRMNARR